MFFFILHMKGLYTCATAFLAVLIILEHLRLYFITSIHCNSYIILKSDIYFRYCADFLYLKLFDCLAYL